LNRAGIILAAASLLAFAQPASAQDAFKPEQVKSGSETYARHCAPCHGPRMADPEGAPDLRKFPRDQRERFLASVSKGKNSMPPWGELLKPDEIDALWAYVAAGGKN
jgi:mono/diheme cytochrome c family protein